MKTVPKVESLKLGLNFIVESRFNIFGFFEPLFEILGLVVFLLDVFDIIESLRLKNLDFISTDLKILTYPLISHLDIF